jgi:hypothetical protein
LLLSLDKLLNQHNIRVHCSEQAEDSPWGLDVVGWFIGRSLARRCAPSFGQVPVWWVRTAGSGSSQWKPNPNWFWFLEPVLEQEPESDYFKRQTWYGVPGSIYLWNHN